jgi:hypothetical protein
MESIDLCKVPENMTPAGGRGHSQFHGKRKPALPYRQDVTNRYFFKG